MNKSAGALYGLAIGDALGSTLEFSDPDEYPDFPHLMTGPHTEMIGQGPFCLRPGQVTDDTMMALCLANSLAEKKGWDLLDVRKRYRDWVTLTCDAGRLTKQALKIGGHEAWVKSGYKSAGNGSLMRCAPIAVMHPDNPHWLTTVSLADSALTHYDPKCQFACVALNYAIAEGIHNPTSTPKSMREAALQGLSNAMTELNRRDSDLGDLILTDGAAIKQDLDFANAEDPLLYDFTAAFMGDPDDPSGEDFDTIKTVGGLSITGTTMGYVRVALRLAFWELMHAPSFEAALLDVVNRGGDSDTNGAITGALLGSLYGEEDGAIPERWLNPVLNCKPGGPFDTIYHPSTFDTLLEASNG